MCFLNVEKYWQTGFVISAERIKLDISIRFKEY